MKAKFRGFRTKTEEWVEGNLIYREEPYQHDIVTPIGNSSTISYAVERDSTGQWTGLKDKNGVEIYEGDIVVAWSNGIKGTFEIKWRQGGSPSWILYPAWQNSEFWNLHGSLHKDGQYYDKGIEVLGNIYENPELLEVAE